MELQSEIKELEESVVQFEDDNKLSIIVSKTKVLLQVKALMNKQDKLVKLVNKNDQFNMDECAEQIESISKDLRSTIIKLFHQLNYVEGE